MKPKNSFPGNLRSKFSFGALWEEHKYTIILLLIGLVLLIGSVVTYAQVPQNNHTHNAGHVNKTPKRTQTADLAIDNIINYKSTTLKLSDFKDRLLILDFWATYCGPCLKLLPRYDSLQKQYAGRLQILLVTHEKTQTALAFLKAHHYMLPSVTADTALSKAFPHNSIPHEVWIDKGVVVAQTFGEDVERATIEKVLAGNSVALAPKQNTPFDQERPLYADGNGRTLKTTGQPDITSGIILCQSLFTRFNPGLNTIAGIDHGSRYINVFALNGSPVSLYHLAFREIDPLLDVSNRFVLEVPDSLRDALGDRPHVDRAWERRYGLCYNMALPAGFKGELGPTIVGDLNRFFAVEYGIEAVIEPRAIDCLVLSRIPGQPLVIDKGRAPIFHSDTDSTEVSGLPLYQLVIRLAYLQRRLPTPLIDETGYTGPVDIRISGNIADRAQLDRGLAQNGLRLTKERRSIPMVVIRLVNQPARPYEHSAQNDSTTLKPKP